MENNMQHRHILLCALGVGCVGLILYIVGFATPKWYDDGDRTIGYWKHCVGRYCQDTVDRLNRNYHLDLYGLTEVQLILGRAFELWGMFSAALGLLLVYLRMVQPSVYSDEKGYRASNLLLVNGGCWGLIGVIHFCGISFCIPNGGYSLALNIAGSCLLIATGITEYLANPEVTVPTVREDSSSPI